MSRFITIGLTVIAVLFCLRWVWVEIREADSCATGHNEVYLMAMPVFPTPTTMYITYLPQVTFICDQRKTSEAKP